MELIGREYELEKLKKMLIPDQPDFLAVYDRRRVTKTSTCFVAQETKRTWIEYFIFRSLEWTFVNKTKNDGDANRTGRDLSLHELPNE